MKTWEKPPEEKDEDGYKIPIGGVIFGISFVLGAIGFVIGLIAGFPTLGGMVGFLSPTVCLIAKSYRN